MLRFFALKTERFVQYHHATPLPLPCVGCNDVMTMGHGLWVMGQLCDGSHGSWVTKDDSFPSLHGDVCLRSKLHADCSG